MYWSTKTQCRVISGMHKHHIISTKEQSNPSAIICWNQSSLLGKRKHIVADYTTLISYYYATVELFQPWVDPKCNIFLIFYLRKPCTYISTAHFCSWLVWTPDCMHHRATRKTPITSSKQPWWPFGTQTTINQKINHLIKSSILLLVD